MNVATALNKKYLLYTGVMLYSLCVNNKVPLRIFLLHSDLEEQDIQYLKEALKEFDVKIIALKVDKAQFNERLPVNLLWSLEAYYRLLLLDILPEDVDRLLYLDVDTIVNKSLEELYTIDFAGKEMIVTEDQCGEEDLSRFVGKRQEMLGPLFEQGHKYFCSGILLMNIAEMRKKYNFKTYVQVIEAWEYQMEAPDQDILNYVHWQNIGYADPKKYDLMVYIAYARGYTYERVKQEVSIVHYAGGKKPWNANAYSFEIEQLWWDYARHLPYYIQLLEEYLHETLFNNTIQKFIFAVENQRDEVRVQLNESMELNKKLLGLLQMK